MTWWNRPNLKNYEGIICDGSVRSGKTLSMSVGFISWSMTCFDGEVFAICGKTIESLRRNVIFHLHEWLEGIFEIVEKRSENRLVISGGGHTNTYYLFGGKDESSQSLIQGITLSGVMFDETALMPRSFVEQAIARCSVEGSKFWFNCNPDGPEHWFLREWINKRHKKNLLYLHFTMEDNPSLSEATKKRYDNLYTGVFYSRFILGKWVQAEGLVYPMFDEDTMVTEERPQFNPRHRYYVAIDYGTVNPFAAGLYDFDPTAKTAMKIKELYYNGRSSHRVDDEAYYKMLKKLIGNVPIQCIVIDPSAASFIETINKHGEYVIRRARNDVIFGIQVVTSYLTAGVLKFHSSCRSTIKEFHSYAWDEKSQKDEVLKENDHAMDELRYFCLTVLRDELIYDIDIYDS